MQRFKTFLQIISKIPIQFMKVCLFITIFPIILPIIPTQTSTRISVMFNVFRKIPLENPSKSTETFSRDQALFQISLFIKSGSTSFIWGYFRSASRIIYQKNYIDICLKTFVEYKTFKTYLNKTQWITGGISAKPLKESLEQLPQIFS